MLINDLREARRSSGLSQRALADRVGVSTQMIKRLEQHSVGSVPTLLAVIRALDYQITGIGPGTCLIDQLCRRRRKKGLSIEELAKRTGLSRNTIRAVEQGQGSVASLLKLLEVLAPNARRRAKERAYWGADDKNDRDSRFTPADFMAHIYEAFGPVDLDPCCHELSPVIARRRIIVSEGGDGLTEPWVGNLVYVNPPYAQLLVWLRRAHEQWQAGNAKTVVCLVPVRTDSAWFQTVLSKDAAMYMLSGRIRFIDTRGKAQPTPFSLTVLTLGATAEQRARFAKIFPGYWTVREG
ncbi:MAG: hypothetical protein C0491_07085 [Novosphingobium sp.]|nr:hypothetical protein [Novosphingobium sp.]